MPDENALEDEAHELNRMFDCIPFIPTDDDDDEWDARLSWRTI